MSCVCVYMHVCVRYTSPVWAASWWWCPAARGCSTPGSAWTRWTRASSALVSAAWVDGTQPPATGRASAAPGTQSGSRYTSSEDRQQTNQHKVDHIILHLKTDNETINTKWITLYFIWKQTMKQSTQSGSRYTSSEDRQQTNQHKMDHVILHLKTDNETINTKWITLYFIWKQTMKQSTQSGSRYTSSENRQWNDQHKVDHVILHLKTDNKQINTKWIT